MPAVSARTFAQRVWRRLTRVLGRPSALTPRPSPTPRPDTSSTPKPKAQRLREHSAALKAANHTLKVQVRKLEAQRERLQEKVSREHVNAEGLADRVQRLTARSLEQDETLLRAKAQHARTHRSVLSVDIVRGLLRSRWAMAQARACLPDARDRASRFLETSASCRAVRDGVEKPPPPELVRITMQGVPYWVPALRPVDAEPGSRWLEKQRFPYRGVLQTREVSVGGIMLDLGANVGHMSVARAMLGDITAAYCAEPDPLNYECLVRTVVENQLEGLVMPDRVAIGAAAGTARLRRGRFPGGHRIVEGADETTLDVEITTLDAWVRRHAIPLPLVTFVKVDVQGLEPQVIEGAGEVLAHSHIAWQVEVCPRMLRDTVPDVPAYLARLASLFTHFTDLNRAASGPRGRPTAELAEALSYLGQDDASQTDVLLFNLSE